MDKPILIAGYSGALSTRLKEIHNHILLNKLQEETKVLSEISNSDKTLLVNISAYIQELLKVDSECVDVQKVNEDSVKISILGRGIPETSKHIVEVLGFTQHIREVKSLSKIFDTFDKKEKARCKHNKRKGIHNYF